MEQNTELVAGLFSVVNAEELGVAGIRRGRGGSGQYAEAIRTLASLEAGKALQMTVFGKTAAGRVRSGFTAANKAAKSRNEGVTLITRTRETGNTNEDGEPEINLYFIKGADDDADGDE
jgi:hypothetical protein